jgi:hypothetical protein
MDTHIHDYLQPIAYQSHITLNPITSIHIIIYGSLSMVLRLSWIRDWLMKDSLSYLIVVTL